LVSGSPSDSNPYQFTGRENDGTGLYYYRARYYDPTWGRFISEDPLNLASTQTTPASSHYGQLLALLQSPTMLNVYLYVGNNPLTRQYRLGLLWGGVSGIPPDMGTGGLPGAPLPPSPMCPPIPPIPDPCGCDGTASVGCQICQQVMRDQVGHNFDLDPVRR